MRRLFVLGAGASAHHSNNAVPVTSGFLSKAFGSGSDASKRLRENPDFALVASLVKHLYRFDPTNASESPRLATVNIEELVTLAELESELTGGATQLTALTSFIRDAVDAFQGEVPSSFKTYATFGRALTNEDSLISFNWDTLLEPCLPGYRPPELQTPATLQFAEYLQICTSELSGTWGNLGSPRPYVSLTSSYEQEIGFRPTPAFLKMHGSIDAVYCRNPSCGNNQRPFRVKATPRALRCGACFEDLAPYIVPPVLAKPIRTMPYIRRAWRKARELVLDCEQMIVWGYSLPPTDFWANWLIRGIAAGRCQSVVIINPEVKFRREDRHNLTFVRRFIPQILRDAAWFKCYVCLSYDDYAGGRLQEIPPSDFSVTE